MNRVSSIGSYNGLAPGRRQAIIWTNVGILLIGPLGKSIGEIFIKINTFSFKNMYLKMPSAKWRPFCPGEDELRAGTLSFPSWVLDKNGTKAICHQWTEITFVVQKPLKTFTKHQQRIWHLKHFSLNKMLPFCRWHFQMYLLQWKLQCFDLDFTEVISWVISCTKKLWKLQLLTPPVIKMFSIWWCFHFSVMPVITSIQHGKNPSRTADVTA